MNKVITLLFVICIGYAKAQTYETLKELSNDTVLVKVHDSDYASFGFGRFFDNEMQGDWFFYNEEKIMVQKAFYIDGQQYGILINYFPSGLISNTYEMVDGIPMGKYVQFYENGTVQMIAIYKEGEIYGDVYEYNSNGTFRGKYMQHGDIVIDSLIIFDENGNLEFSGFFNEIGKKNGDHCYLVNGKIDAVEKYRNDSLIGIIEYYENGIIKFYGEYKDYLPEGIEYTNHPNGIRESEGVNHNGMRQGTWKYFTEEGVLRSQTEYIDNIGYGKIFDSKGKLYGEGQIYYNHEFGRWTYYNKKGKEKYYTDFGTKEEIIAYHYSEGVAE
jgi:antitoxin component YwqK of YwqJK toxin-antitoxin module